MLNTIFFLIELLFNAELTAVVEFIVDKEIPAATLFGTICLTLYATPDTYPGLTEVFVEYVIALLVYDTFAYKGLVNVTYPPEGEVSVEAKLHFTHTYTANGSLLLNVTFGRLLIVQYADDPDPFSV